MRRRFTDSSEKGTSTEERVVLFPTKRSSRFFRETIRTMATGQMHLGSAPLLCRLFFHREIIVSRSCRNFLATDIDVGRLDAS